MLPSTIGALLRGGVDVHYIDNWSTDSTARDVAALQHALARQRTRVDRGGASAAAGGIEPTLTYERFPASGPTGTYDWGNLLRRKEALGARLAWADWVIHCDPDEIRESPWGPGVPLRTAVYVAQALGYNQLNFNNLVVFRPVVGQVWPPATAAAAPGATGRAGRRGGDGGGGGGLKESFVHYDREGLEIDRVRQIKGWRRKFPAGSLRAGDRVAVDLASSGGHEATYRSPAWLKGKVMPWSFVLRHYPIRSQAHGVRKVFAERKARWNATERKAAWHAQYDDVANATHSFLADAKTLRHAPHGVLPPEMYAQDVPCLPGDGEDGGVGG